MLLFAPAADALKTFRITATSPPTIVSGWSTFPVNGCGSPWVTSTDGTNNMIVWVVGTGDSSGSGGDQRLHGYDGDTGAVVYGGGGANELMAGTHTCSTTGIVARGRIYVAGDNKVYAFKLPGGTPTPTPTATPTPTPTADANTDSTTTDTDAYTNCNSNSNTNGNSNCYSDTNKPTWEYMPPANDGEPYSCSRHAVEFYGPGKRH